MDACGGNYYRDLLAQAQAGKPFIVERLALLDDWLRPKGKTQRLLEVACGSGYGAAALARDTRRQVIAFDHDGEPLRLIRAERVVPPTVPLFRGTVYALPFPGGTFDAACCSEVVEHLHKPKRALRELRRVLRPGGMLLVSTWPNRQNFSVRRAAAKGHDFSPPDFNKQTPGELRALIRAAGFSIERACLRNIYFQVPKTRLIFDHLVESRGMKKVLEDLLERTLLLNPLAAYLANAIYFLARRP